MEFGKEWQGQTVDGRYPLERYLGGSETTAVFLTQLPADAKTRAAIKLILATGAESDNLVANWKRAAQLSHPHLLRVFDGGKCWLSGNELVYVVTEFADENLAQVVPQRALTTSEADSMLRPTLSALSYLHDQGLAHGGLHPANVMAVGDQLKLAPDHIAATGTTQHGLKTSEYDAPELRDGQLSSAADVWSLGVMLVESLTQHLPQGKADVEKLLQPYGEIAGRCLAKDPKKRWTVRDIADAIQLHPPAAKNTAPSITDRAVVERPQVASVPVVEPRRGSRRITGLVFFLLVVAILAITLTVKLLNQKPTPTSQNPPATISSGQPASAQSAAVLHQVMPNVSMGALRTIQGHVKVRVRVNADPDGHVIDARFISEGPSKYFARHSMEAARHWTFTPPIVDGQARPSEWNILFEFSRTGVKAIPSRVT